MSNKTTLIINIYQSYLSEPCFIILKFVHFLNLCFNFFFKLFFSQCHYQALSYVKLKLLIFCLFLKLLLSFPKGPHPSKSPNGIITLF